MASARPVDCAPEGVICNPNATGLPQWGPIGPTMATCAAHPTNSACPARFFGVPKHSGLHFFTFVIDFDTLRTLEIIEKPWENLGFSMVFMNSTNLLQNRQNAASGCSATLKMKTFGTQNDTSRQQNEPPELQIEAQERPDGPSERQMNAQLLLMLLTAVFDAPGSFRE